MSDQGVGERGEGTRFADREGTRWRVREFRPADREPLLETYRDFAPSERAMHLPPVDEARLVDWLDELLEEGYNVVAVREDRASDDATVADESDLEVVGHATYTPADAAEPDLAVFVHQEYQARGLGTELCRQVVAAAAAADRDALVLDVEPRNRTAVRLYERLGFERVDEAGAGPGRGAVRMRLALSSAGAVGAGEPTATGD